MIDLLSYTGNFFFLFLCFLHLFGFILRSDIILSLFSIWGFLITYFKFCLVSTSGSCFRFVHNSLLISRVFICI